MLRKFEYYYDNYYTTDGIDENKKEEDEIKGIIKQLQSQEIEIEQEIMDVMTRNSKPSKKIKLVHRPLIRGNEFNYKDVPKVSSSIRPTKRKINNITPVPQFRGNGYNYTNEASSTNLVTPNTNGTEKKEMSQFERMGLPPRYPKLYDTEQLNSRTDVDKGISKA